MNRFELLLAIVLLIIPGVVLSQDVEPESSTPPATQQNQSAIGQQPTSPSPPASTARAPSANDKAECDAEAERTYSHRFIGGGIGKKRDALFAACIAKRTDPDGQVANSPEVKKVECEAEVARTYPYNLIGGGIGKKRQELQDACMARQP